jgi:hypothetical protein
VPADSDSSNAPSLKLSQEWAKATPSKTSNRLQRTVFFNGEATAGNVFADQYSFVRQQCLMRLNYLRKVAMKFGMIRLSTLWRSQIVNVIQSVNDYCAVSTHWNVIAPQVKWTW